MLSQLLVSTYLALLNPVQIDRTDVDLVPGLLHLSESTTALRADELILQLDRFTPVPQGNPNFGLHPDVLWLAARVQGGSPRQKYVIGFDYPHLDFVDLYVFDENKRLLNSSKGGDHLNFVERYRPHRTINFPLDFSESASQILLFRIETQSSLQAGIRIQTLEYFDEIAAQENAGNFLYYGIILVMFILNIFWFLILKDNLYLPYIGYLLFYLGGQMSINGTLFQFVLPEHPLVANTFLLFSLSLSLAFATNFCNRFNELAQHSPKFSKTLDVIFYLGLFTAVLSLFASYRIVLAPMLLLGLTAPLSALGSGMIGLRNDVKSAKIFIAAWLFFLLGTIVFVLKTAGMFPSVFLTEHGMQIGSALEVVLLTLALGDRVRAIIADRDALTQRVTKQTLILAEETEKRAHAEQTLRESLEERMLLINDASHHLNNPLNHIQQANQIVQTAEVPIRQHLVSLFADAGAEAAEVQQFFEAELDKIQSSSAVIEHAITRSALTVELLNHLAGEERNTTQTYRVEELRALLEQRGVKLDFDTMDQSLRLVGSPMLMAFALETLVRNVRQPKEGLVMRVNSLEEPKAHSLILESCVLTSSNQMDKSLKAAKLLLKQQANIFHNPQSQELRLETVAE